MQANDMPFLVLTRQGYDDLVARIRPAGARLRLNPGIASNDELARLRAEGAEVEVLPAPLSPDRRGEVDALLDAFDGALWVERVAAQLPPSLPLPVTQAEAAQAPPAGRREALRQRLADTAGTFARQALRRLRVPGLGRQLMLIPYQGFGNARTLWIKGRVLDEAAFREQSHDDSGWRNLVALYRRLEADEVPGARVTAQFQGRSYEAITDDGGYFTFEIAADPPLPGGAHRIELSLPDARAPGGGPVTGFAEALVPEASARFGIISDIDDTVLWTNVTNKLNMALMLARTNAHTRKPFKGVAAFYRALRDGAGGNEANPVFYVSSSPWHLYGPLVDFMRLQGIPLGPLLLREIGLRDVFKLTKHGNHKLEKIELILRFYPRMQFVLIGDSGERDPEIYAEILRRHPGSVRMIYIRNVNPDPARIEALDRLIEETSSTGTQLVLAPDSVFAASHAAAEGLIQVDRLGAVRQDKREDEGKPAAG